MNIFTNRKLKKYRLCIQTFLRRRKSLRKESVIGEPLQLTVHKVFEHFADCLLNIGTALSYSTRHFTLLYEG